MLKSSLLEILRTFSKAELAKFEDFIRSPFYNKKGILINLFLIIKKYSPQFNDNKLEKEKVWFVLFPESEYNYGIMKNIIFDLTKLTERYVILIKFSEDKLSESKYLLTFLRDKDLSKMFLNKFDQIERSNSTKRGNINVNGYYGFWMDLLILKSNVLNNTKESHTLLEVSSLNLIISFLINSFKIFQNLVVANSDLNINFENNPVALFLRQISPESFHLILENARQISRTDHFYLELYYKMYCMFFDTDGKSYLSFKKLLFDNVSMLVKKDLRDLHFCLISANDIIADPKHNLSEEKLSVFDSMIKLNILTEPHGAISEHIFVYYVSLAFQSYDIKRINTFSDKFAGKLDEGIQDNIIKYVKSLNYFVEKKYEESLNEISRIDPNYFIMKLYLRYIKGRCLYKMKDYEMFLNEYDSVKHFIKNNDKLNDRLKIKLEKFYYFLNHLFKLRENYNEFEISKLKTETVGFYKNEWNWVLVEIENLINKHMKK